MSETKPFTKSYAINRIAELLEENERLKDDKNRYELYIKQERDNNYKYKQALEEIREMFNNCCFKANFLNNCDSDCKYINECNGELSVIQKRISEVLDERN